MTSGKKKLVSSQTCGFFLPEVQEAQRRKGLVTLARGDLGSFKEDSRGSYLYRVLSARARTACYLPSVSSFCSLYTLLSSCISWGWRSLTARSVLPLLGSFLGHGECRLWCRWTRV